MKFVTIALKQGDVQKAKDFAAARRDQKESMSNYAKKGSTNADRVEYCCYIGALAEMAIYKFFKKLGVKVKAPDFSIYAVKDKSFSADLPDNNGNMFHCKGQSPESKARYGIGWVFDKNDDPLFRNYTNKDYVVLTCVDHKNLEVQIHGVIKVEDVVKKDLLREPDNKWFVNQKVKLDLNEVHTLSWYERWGRLKKCIMV